MLWGWFVCQFRAMQFALPAGLEAFGKRCGFSGAIPEGAKEYGKAVSENIIRYIFINLEGRSGCGRSAVCRRCVFRSKCYWKFKEFKSLGMEGISLEHLHRQGIRVFPAELEQKNWGHC